MRKYLLKHHQCGRRVGECLWTPVWSLQGIFVGVSLGRPTITIGFWGYRSGIDTTTLSLQWHLVESTERYTFRVTTHCWAVTKTWRAPGSQPDHFPVRCYCSRLGKRELGGAAGCLCLPSKRETITNRAAELCPKLRWVAMATEPRSAELLHPLLF